MGQVGLAGKCKNNNDVGGRSRKCQWLLLHCAVLLLAFGVSIFSTFGTVQAVLYK